MSPGYRDVEQRFEVRVERAFPGLLAPEMEPRIREVLANPERSRAWKTGARRPQPQFNALRYARCAYEVEPGVPCGRVVRPLSEHKTTRFHYVGMGCESMRVPHRTYIPSALDHHLVTVVLDVFRPERLHQLKDRIHAEKQAYGEVRTAAEGRLTRLQKEAQAATDEILEIRIQTEEIKDEGEKKKKRALLDRWKATLEECEGKIARLEAELEGYRRREADFQSASEEDLRKIVQLASDLPALLERARTVPGALSRILYDIVHLVRVRRLGQGVYEMQIQFPDGATVRRVFWHGKINFPQPVRVLAFERLRAGVNPDELAEEMKSAFVYGRERAVWSAQRVQGAAAYHQYFDDTRVREGEHVSIESLAKLVKGSEEIVRAVALEGRLGPARWAADQLVFCPTEPELHSTCPEFARVSVAELHGLDPADLIPAATLRSKVTGRDGGKEITRRRLDRWMDAAGRCYVLRSAAERMGLTTEPDPSAGERLRAHLAAVVSAQAQPGLSPECFHRIGDLLTTWKYRFPFVSRKRIEDAMERGWVHGVRVPRLLRNGGASTKYDWVFVYVPEAVLHTDDPAVVRRWLWEGGEPPERAVGWT